MKSTEHEFSYPTVREIPLVRETLSPDTFNSAGSYGEPDETGYPPNVAVYAKGLARLPLAEVVDLNEYRKAK